MKRIFALLGLLSFICGAQEMHAAYRVLHSFAGGPEDGAHPRGDLLLHDGCIYGMTTEGGKHNGGVLFRIDADGAFTTPHHFGNLEIKDGRCPSGSLAAGDTTLYGMTPRGGSYDKGLLFSWSVDGTGYRYLWDFGEFAGDGEDPKGGPIFVDKKLYGMTSKGGAHGQGALFSMRKIGHHASYQIAHDFTGGADDGAAPRGGLLAMGGRFYGMTEQGGAYELNGGTIYSVKPDGSEFALLHSFSGDDGMRPQGSLASDGQRLYGMIPAAAGLMEPGARAVPGPLGSLGKIFSIGLDGTGFSVLHSLEGGVADGGLPRGSLLLAGDTLYGMTATGGGEEIGPGVVFSMRTDGTQFTLLHVFDGLREGTGTQPHGSLVSDGKKLYGMTYGGGAEGMGAIFSLDIPPPAPAPTPAPQAEIVLNGTVFEKGAQFTATFRLNRSVEQPFTAYAVVALPDGFMLDALTLGPQIVPVASNVPRLDAPFRYPLLTLNIPAGAPPGNYSVMAGFFTPGEPISGPQDAFLLATTPFAVQ